jgi:DNA-binding helix-hairpin-helix protein with protein kinase domain
MRRRLTLAEQIGGGAEGRVFAVQGFPGLAVKLCSRPKGPKGEDPREGRGRYLRRVSSMAATIDYRSVVRDGHISMALPIAPVQTLHSSPVPGLAMLHLRAAHYQPLTALIDPDRRAKRFPPGSIGWTHLVNAALNLTRVISYAQEQKWVIVDLTPRNLFVTQTGRIAAIDTDSWQYVDPNTGERFPCWVSTPDYAAPEITAEPAGSWHQPTADWFGLGVIVCELLLAGDHPFDGVPKGLPVETPHTRVDAIASGQSRLLDPDSMDVPPWSTPVDVLPPPVHTLAARCFGMGRTDPGRRPRPTEWMPVLQEVLAESTVCQHSPSHHFHPSRSTCPWCELVDKGFPDRFPTHATAPGRFTAPPSVLATPSRRGAPSPAQPAPPPDASAVAPTTRPPANPVQAPNPSRQGHPGRIQTWLIAAAILAFLILLLARLGWY